MCTPYIPINPFRFLSLPNNYTIELQFYVIIIIIIIIIIIAVESFVGPWRLFQFLDPIHSR
jgi:hypothetical protein